MSAPAGLARGDEVYVHERFGGGDRWRLARVEEVAKRGARVILLDSRSTIKRWVLWKDVEMTPPGYVPAALPGRVDLSKKPTQPTLPGFGTPVAFMAISKRREPIPEPTPIEVSAKNLDKEPIMESADENQDKQTRRLFSNNEKRLVKRLFSEGRSDAEIAAEVARTRPGTDADAVSAARSRWGFVNFRRGVDGRKLAEAKPRAPKVTPAPPPRQEGSDVTITVEAPGGVALRFSVTRTVARSVVELIGGL